MPPPAPSKASSKLSVRYWRTRRNELFRKSANGYAFVGFRMLLGETLGDDTERRLSLFQARARLEPSHEIERALGALRPGILNLLFVFGADVRA